MAELYRYAAFISYSSRDADFARRLHRALEHYGIPSSLGKFDLIGGGKKNRIYPVFRDREELSAGQLGDQIEANLKASGALIVVCSPSSAVSPWVEKEIEFFAAQGRQKKILAIISDTAPLLDEQGTDATRSCFPPAFSGDALRGDKLEPLAADARKGKDGFRNAWLKVVAGMIGVSPGQIIDRDRKRRSQQRLLLFAAIGAFATATLTSVAAVSEQAWRTRLAAEALSIAQEDGAQAALPFAIGAAVHDGAILPMVGGGSIEALAQHPGLMMRYDLGALSESPSFSADGRRLAARSIDGIGFLLDLEIGSRTSLGPLREYPRVSPNGEWLALVAQTSNAAIINVVTGARIELGALGRRFDGISDEQMELAPLVFSADGSAVAAWNEAGHWSAYQLASGASLQLGNGSATPEFSTDGNWVVTADRHGNTSAYRLSDGARRSLGVLTIEGSSLSLEFAPHRALLAAESIDRIWTVVDLETGAERPLGTLARNGFNSAVAFSWDGSHLAAQSGDSVGFTLNTSTGEIVRLGELRVLPTFVGHRQRLVAWRTDDRAFAIEPESGAHLELGLLQGYLDFSPNNEWLAARDAAGSWVLVNLVDGKRTEVGPFREWLRWSPDSSSVSGVTDDGDGFVLATGGLQPTTFGLVRSMSGFSPDGRYLYSRLNDQDFSLFTLDARKRKLLRGMHLDPTFSPTGEFVLAQAKDQTWFVLDLDAWHDRQSTAGQTALAWCADPAFNQIVRPFTEKVRGQTEPVRGNLDLARRRDHILSDLRGRPWNPCDWRGLVAIWPDKERGDDWFEGPRQWLRLMHFRHFGGPDYGCGETKAAGQTTRARLESCRLAGVAHPSVR